jgi:hypothetical protein
MHGSIRKQEGKFQKDKTNINLPNKWVFGVGSIEATRRNEEHHENVDGAGNIDSSANGGSAHLSLNPRLSTESEMYAGRDNNC